MNRREAIAAIPLAAAGTALFARPAGAAPDAIQASRPLHLVYVDRIIGIIERIRDTQTDVMLEAAGHIASTYRAGRTNFCQWETGHSFDGDMFPDRPGDTDLFVMGYTMSKPTVEPQSGDLLLVSVLRAPLEDPRAKGIFVVGGPTPWCGDTTNPELLVEANRALRIKPYSDIWIETFIPTRGGLVWLPGADTPLGDTSGALGMVTYWAMCADAVRLLARDGGTVQVRGDEPELGESAAWEDIDRPLGSAYLDTALSQMRQIEAEDGSIDRIAAMAADAVLNGGRLWVYSRYQAALSSEANAKRSGLALINSTWSGDDRFDGTERDVMIIGAYRPDDPADKTMLESCRGRKMKVATIGTATLDGRVPENAVITAGDLHLGCMCDTYGLFAIPGVKRKVCPTSGLLMTVMFWSTMVQLAEIIMERTGNTPAVLSTGAIIDGGAQRQRMTDLAKRRGY